MIPAGHMITGAVIKIATILIISGEIIAYVGDKSLHMSGYNVVPASAYRKQAFLAKTDTYMTMLFSTSAKMVEDAENEFTDETDTLISRKPNGTNKIIITGE